LIAVYVNIAEKHSKRENLCEVNLLHIID